MERLKMRTNENSRSTADDGITLRVFMAVMSLAEISAAILERFSNINVYLEQIWCGHKKISILNQLFPFTIPTTPTHLFFCFMFEADIRKIYFQRPNVPNQELQQLIVRDRNRVNGTNICNSCIVKRTITYILFDLHLIYL